jgi:hypothetical protein
MENPPHIFILFEYSCVAVAWIVISERYNKHRYSTSAVLYVKHCTCSKVNYVKKKNIIMSLLDASFFCFD